MVLRKLTLICIVIQRKGLWNGSEEQGVKH